VGMNVMPMATSEVIMRELRKLLTSMNKSILQWKVIPSLGLSDGFV